MKNTNVHTAHCCKNCGCKYGEDKREFDPFEDNVTISCDVVAGRKTQENECKGDCFNY